MKRMALYGGVLIALALMVGVAPAAMAQCSICTKTASQLGPEAAKGLNAGILYLAALPFALGGVIGYRWWKGNKEAEQGD